MSCISFADQITYIIKCTRSEVSPNLMKIISQDKTREIVTYRAKFIFFLLREREFEANCKAKAF